VPNATTRRAIHLTVRSWFNFWKWKLEHTYASDLSAPQFFLFTMLRRVPHYSMGIHAFTLLLVGVLQCLTLELSQKKYLGSQLLICPAKAEKLKVSIAKHKIWWDMALLDPPGYATVPDPWEVNTENTPRWSNVNHCTLCWWQQRLLGGGGRATPKRLTLKKVK